MPAYNEEESIAGVIVRAKRFADKVFVCDDGSSDATAEIARQLGAQVFAHDRNSGYGAALATLFDEARREKADIFVTLDADGQHQPEEIPVLVKPIIDGEADIVIGSRFLTDSHVAAPMYRQAGVKVITRFTNLVSNESITDSQSGLRAYNRRALDSLTLGEMGMGASTELLVKSQKAGLRIAEVPVNVLYNEDSSTHNPLYHGLDVVLATVKHVSIRHPLMFYGIPGISLLGIALGFWYWAAEAYITTKTLMISVSLLAICCTLVGAMLMTTAVILWVVISVVRGGTATKGKDPRK
jgi:glycosyltransferase involved in cell wall biosynthesis